jgi:hypothetical protein
MTHLIHTNFPFSLLLLLLCTPNYFAPSSITPLNHLALLVFLSSSQTLFFFYVLVLGIQCRAHWTTSPSSKLYPNIWYIQSQPQNLGLTFNFLYALVLPPIICRIYIPGIP